ncbi:MULTISPECIES: acetyltransferase [unclassified Ensifer]|uniref:acetyltransferase n=1 Tax=unclassified Ensifer TaxID=2633371 RepID=UPI000712F08A|nr:MULTISPECIES: acetyltransferase [unclassified Ensifer]KRD62186.1 hypothetical protein ASE71_07930 [Ensifer sp. Root954]
MLIVGAGGHAKVVIEIARARGFEPACCTDANPTPRTVLSVPVIGGDEQLEAIFASGIRLAVVALGDNALRVRLSRQLLDMGYALPALVSPGALVSGSASVGRSSVVMSGAVINAETIIGDFAIINTNASVDHDCSVGHGAHIAPAAAVTGAVRIGECAFIGAGAILLPNISVGSSAIIGAGAVVNRDVPTGAKFVGIPARPLSSGEVK